MRFFDVILAVFCDDSSIDDRLCLLCANTRSNFSFAAMNPTIPTSEASFLPEPGSQATIPILRHSSCEKLSLMVSNRFRFSTRAFSFPLWKGSATHICAAISLLTTAPRETSNPCDQVSPSQSVIASRRIFCWRWEAKSKQNTELVAQPCVLCCNV